MYFDCAATSMPKPKQVTDAVVNAMNTYANPSRGAYRASVGALRCLMSAREAVADYFGVGSPMRVAFCQNATEALNIAIGSLKGHVVTTAAEHNSVLRPLYRRSGEYTIVPVDGMGRLDLDKVADAVRPDTVAVVMTHASNVTGNGYDIARMGRICREKGVFLIVDAAQSAGLLPIHMEEMGISALCFSGHKSLLGPQGTGGLCLSDSFQAVPLFVGGSGSRSFSKQHPGDMPEALEAGTQNVHGIAGLLEGIRYVKAGGDRLQQEGAELAAEFVGNLREMPRVALYGDWDSPIRTPVVSLNVAGMDSGDLAFRLEDHYGIAVRAGAHCAPLMHRAMGTQNTGAVRFSFSHQNTTDEVRGALQALREICME